MYATADVLSFPNQSLGARLVHANVANQEGVDGKLKSYLQCPKCCLYKPNLYAG